MTDVKWAIDDKLEIVNAKGISGYKQYGLRNGMVVKITEIESAGHIWTELANKRRIIILPSEFKFVRKLDPKNESLIITGTLKGEVVSASYPLPNYKELYEEALKKIHQLENPDTRLTFAEKARLADQLAKDLRKEIKNDPTWQVANTVYDTSSPESYTVAFLINCLTGEVRTGKSKCSYSDQFNEHIGEVIALLRALGREVPKEFLEGTKPDEQ